MDTTKLLSMLPNCKLVWAGSQKENEEKWLQVRTSGIGGSDIGSICGVNEYSSPRQIYYSKVSDDTQEFSDDAKERMHFGHVLEPVVATEYAQRTGARLIELDATVMHKDYPWARANVDRLILDEFDNPIGILECKTAGEYQNEKWEEGMLPQSYFYQLQWYLWILGLEHGAFACLVGGNKFYFYDIYIDMDLINNTLFPTAKKFWEENIVKQVPPELEATDKDYINAEYAAVNVNSEITFDDRETDDLVASVVDLRAKAKLIKKDLEAAENRLKEKLADHEYGYTANHTARWAPRSRTNVDSKVLKSAYPDIYEKVTYQSSYRVLTVKSTF